MNEYNELKMLDKFFIEILEHPKTKEIVLTIDSGDEDKTIIHGKSAINFITLVDDYINNLKKESK